MQPIQALNESATAPNGDEQKCAAAPRPVCQLCQIALIEIRGKLQCERCHTIWETCCEGGRS